MDTTEGALAGLKVASTIDQIKAFRQHQEEFAKMERARSAMLQAQSDQEVIKRDHALQLAALEDKAKAAELERQAAVAGPTGEAQINTAKATSLTAMPGAQAALAKFALGQATDTAALPNVSPAAAVQGQIIASQGLDIQNKESLRKTTQETQALAAQLAHKDAAFNLDINADQHKKIAQQLAIDIAGAKDEDELKTAKEKAQIELLKAQADNFAAMKTASGRYEKDPFAKWQKMNALEGQLTNEENKLYTQKVSLPNGQPGTILDYVNATRANPGVNDTSKRAGIFFITRHDVPRNPAAEALLTQIRGIRERKNALAHQIDSVDLGIDESPQKSGSSVLPSANVPVLTVDQVKSMMDRTPAGEEIIFSTPDGRVLKVKGTKK